MNDHLKKLEFVFLDLHTDLVRFFAKSERPSGGSPSAPESSSLMDNVDARVDKTLGLVLTAQFNTIYDARAADGSLDLMYRVNYLRTRHRLQQGLDSARRYKATITATMDKWRPYFEMIMDKVHALLVTIHDRKISQSTFEELSLVVGNLLVQLSRKRTELVAEASKLRLRLECDWVTRTSRLSAYRLECASGTFDKMIEEAAAQHTVHATILNGVDALTQLTSSPTTVSTRDGVEICLDLLPQADVEFRELNVILDNLYKLAEPLLASLEKHIATTSGASANMTH
ncbi:hypothetical protein OH76DRAFT_1490955 [Lentinus brumalis]|uniref:Uncharacterized protein n=1 Tax=Lentinus brumalis TaxID=2498619 RepID=A0A371CH88_9APHY|nr:hypothetical protein OH76DRAFT_1490955 [Polyporus brumalis]